MYIHKRRLINKKLLSHHPNAKTVGCGTESYATEDNYIYTMQFIYKGCLELISYRGSEDTVGVLERADDIH
jgi:hypothetical protein